MAFVDINQPELNSISKKVFPWHQLFRRPQIVQCLEAVQDLIAVSLCVGLFCVMALKLKSIFSTLLNTPPIPCHHR
jgi:hypothetical protein